MYPFTYGKYCGANWSDGKHQQSVCGDTPPIDEFDEACYHHDCELAQGFSYGDANARFIARLAKQRGILPWVTRHGMALVRYGEIPLREIEVTTDGKTRPVLRGSELDFKKRTTARARNRPVSTEIPAGERLTLSEQYSEIQAKLAMAKQQRKGGNTRNTQASKASRQPTGRARGARSAARRSGTQTRFAPTAVGTVLTNQGPSSSYAADGSVRVRHRENLGEVTLSDTAFNVLGSYPLNPGMAATFPWLSTIATRYDKFRIHSLRVLYETETTTSSTGSFMMAIDYNATDDAPTSKVSLMAYKGAVKTVPWLSAVCTFDPKSQDTDGFVRSGFTTTTASDLRVSDPGVLYLATANTAFSGTIGDLYIEYDITLKDPSEIPLMGYMFAAGGTIAASTPFGTYGSQTGAKGATPATWSTNILTFQVPGTYMLAGSGNGSLTTTTGITGNTGTLGDIAISGNGTSWTAYLVFRITKAGQTMMFNNLTGTITSARWYLGLTNNINTT